MKAAVERKLLELNRNFYDTYAEDFSLTRRPINPGFEGLRHALPQPCDRLLDVACGNGRFGGYLEDHGAIGEYVGVDYSRNLLQIAPTLATGTYFERDLSQPNCLVDLGQFEAISCLAALHHIPGWQNRLRLVIEMRDHLRQDGRLLFSTWQFTDSKRQRRKIRPWSEIGLSAGDVEPGDYLLSWQRGGFTYRYLHLIHEEETAKLAAEAGLKIIQQYRSDGREGNLSLYTIFKYS